MRFKIVALLFVFLPLTLQAQSMGSYSQTWTGSDSNGNPQFNIVNNIPNCVAGQNNCWHLSTITLTSLNIGAADGFPCGQDSSKAVHCYNEYPTNTWVHEPQLGNPYAIAVIKDGQFWGLQPDAAHCGSSGAYGVDYFGSSWVYANGCLSQIAAAYDSTIGGATVVNNTAWVLPNGTGSWQQVPGSYWKAYYPTSSTSGFGIKTDGSVWQNSGGTLIQIPSSACTALATDQNLDLYALCSSAVYHYNGSGWDELLTGGSVAAIATGGSMDTWMVGPTQSGANVWRFPDQGYQFGGILGGSANCANGQCGNAVHSSTVRGHWTTQNRAVTPKHSGGTTAVLNNAPPSTQVNLKSMDTILDPFECAELGALGNPCAFSLDQATVNCSVLGTLFTAPNVLLPIGGGIFEVHHRRQSVGYNCSLVNKQLWCSYVTVASCPNAGPYAFNDLQIRGLDADDHNIWGWLVYDACYGFDYGLGKTYTCFPWDIAVPTSAQPPFNCATRQDVLNTIP